MNRALLTVFSVTVIGVLTTQSRAQVFYKPVQYQYSAHGKSYYYGGSNPDVFRFADRRAYFERHVRLGRQLFGGAGYGESGRFSPQSSVYSDCLPPYVDASTYGFTPDDARNEALARIPRYFRKSDLLKSAILDRDGSVIVPPDAPLIIEPRGGSIEIRPYSTNSPPSTTKSAKVLIIPRKKPATSDKPPVASR